MNNNKFFLTNFLFEGEVKPLGGDQLIEEIYKDALNWREENQDKYEEAAVKSLIKEKIYQYFKYKNTTKYIDRLNNIVAGMA